MLTWEQGSHSVQPLPDHNCSPSHSLFPWPQHPWLLFFMIHVPHEEKQLSEKTSESTLQPSKSSLPADVQLNLFWQKEELMIVSLLTYCRMSTFIFTSTFQSDFSRKMGAVGKRKSESPAGLSGKRPLPSGQVSKLWVSHRTEPLYNLTWWLEDSPFSPSPAGWFKHPCLSDRMVYSLFWSSTALSRELPVSSRPLWSVLLHLVQSWAKPHQCWCDPNWSDIVNTWFCRAPSAHTL